MELRHLRYFLAVGEALNFTKAAAQLRVAQMRQRQLADYRSGGRTRYCSGDPNVQTRSWQAPALPPADGHDGSGVRGNRPRHKGRRDTRRGKVLRNLAEDFRWSDCDPAKIGKAFLSEARAVLQRADEAVQQGFDCLLHNRGNP